MEVENDGELTEMLARLARANGEGDAQVVKLRRGPKSKHPDGFKEFHLKFSGDMLERIEKQADYQAYFDNLVTNDIKQQGK